MSKRFYIATALERADEARALSDSLRALGMVPAYEWWQHGSVQAQGERVIAEVAQRELDGIMTANLFVALLPGGRGTHTELGYALAFAGLRIVLIGELKDASGRVCSFYLHPYVSRRFASVDDFLASLAPK